MLLKKITQMINQLLKQLPTDQLIAHWAKTLSVETETKILQLHKITLLFISNDSSWPYLNDITHYSRTSYVSYV